jgi:hypothetical protein
MPETTTGYLDKELADLETRFLNRIKSFMQGRLSKVEKLALFAELDFSQELQYAGLTKVVTKLEKDYYGVIGDLVKQANSANLAITAPTLNDLSVLVSLDAESILRSAEAHSLQFKSSLIKGLVAGESNKEIISRLQDIPLRTNNTIAAITTARDEFEASSVVKVFEGEPETKFKLRHPIDAKTRCSCKAVFLGQPKGGLTKKEIEEENAWHKLAMTCPDYAKRWAEGKQRKYNLVNRGSFGCRGSIEIAE